jgi:acetoin utilization protein AcuB
VDLSRQAAANMKIKAVMTSFPYTVPADMSLEKALEQMKLYNIRHCPVVQDHDLIGVVTKRDIGVAMLLAQSVNATPTVGAICQTDPLVVDEDDDLADVAHEMADEKLDYALVTNEENKFVGIFTTSDACRVAYMLLDEERLEQEDEPEGEDEQ